MSLIWVDKAPKTDSRAETSNADRWVLPEPPDTPPGYSDEEYRRWLRGFCVVLMAALIGLAWWLIERIHDLTIAFQQ